MSDTTGRAIATITRAAESRTGLKNIPRVEIKFTCTSCGAVEGIFVPWSEHHALPKGWASRDVIGSVMLPRRTDHIFACSKSCQKSLDTHYPPPAMPKWFSTS